MGTDLNTLSSFFPLGSPVSTYCSKKCSTCRSVADLPGTTGIQPSTTDTVKTSGASISRGPYPEERHGACMLEVDSCFGRIVRFDEPFVASMTLPDPLMCVCDNAKPPDYFADYISPVCIHVNIYSRPALVDLTEDGVLDLVLGAGNG